MRAEPTHQIVDASWLGAKMLGFSTICFGIACFLQGDFTIFWQPFPESLPFRQPLAFLSAALLVLSGAGLFFARTRRIAAITQVCLFLAYAASWLSVFRSVQPWLGIAEHLATVTGAATVWARLSPQAARGWHFSPAVARIAYGCCSIVFGLAHVVALDGTMSMVPAWLPGGAMFWALFTGAGHFAVGIGLIVNRLAVLATRWASVMYLCFAAFAWLPGAVTHPDQWLRWAGTAITLVMLSAVWLVGDYLREPRGQETSSGLLSPARL
ncbi:DoxX family membrane protein [Peristeroidobacter agariperforans]|uniref:DoxX family membrane protein n=1 Tax=Peristeroidobacter agariperforans TaxID=268404 RepID=UPI00101E105B|nr:DoxX family membrane protein [Peristeroidobacter agariperforans]